MNPAINNELQKTIRISYLVKQQLATKERFCSMQLINYILGPIYIKNCSAYPCVWSRIDLKADAPQNTRAHAHTHTITESRKWHMEET